MRQLQELLKKFPAKRQEADFMQQLTVARKNLEMVRKTLASGEVQLIEGDTQASGFPGCVVFDPVLPVMLPARRF